MNTSPRDFSSLVHLFAGITAAQGATNMKRVVILIGLGTVMLAGLAGAAYAQQSGAGATTPSSFKYEMQGNKRVDRPDSKTTAADGTVREEFKSGNCVKIKETRPDGAIKTSQKCD